MPQELPASTAETGQDSAKQDPPVDDKHQAAIDEQAAGDSLEFQERLRPPRKKQRTQGNERHKESAEQEEPVERARATAEMFLETYRSLPERYLTDRSREAMKSGGYIMVPPKVGESVGVHDFYNAIMEHGGSEKVILGTKGVKELKLAVASQLGLEKWTPRSMNRDYRDCIQPFEPIDRFVKLLKKADGRGDKVIEELLRPDRPIAD